MRFLQLVATIALGFFAANTSAHEPFEWEHTDTAGQSCHAKFYEDGRLVVQVMQTPSYHGATLDVAATTPQVTLAGQSSLFKRGRLMARLTVVEVDGDPENTVFSNSHMLHDQFAHYCLTAFLNYLALDDAHLKHFIRLPWAYLTWASLSD